MELILKLRKEHDYWQHQMLVQEGMDKKGSAYKKAKKNYFNAVKSYRDELNKNKI